MSKSRTIQMALVCALVLSGCTSLKVAGWKSSKTASPNRKVQIQVFTGRAGQLGYRVTFKGRTVIEPSVLGMIVDGKDIGAGVNLGKIERSSLNEQYPWRGVKRTAVNHYNESDIEVIPKAGTPYRLEVRAFNDGIAFRYVIPGAGTKTVSGEETRFTLPADSLVWWAPTRPKFDYEGRYKASRISELREGTKMAPPTTVELPGGGFASLTEGCLVNFAGMHFVSRSNGVMQCGFQQASWDLKDEIKSPWRIVMLADDLNGLVNCDIVHNVCPAPAPELAQADWIKPGMSTWSFLGGGGRTLDNEKLYSTLSSELGFSYNLVDAGWESWPNKWDSLKELVEFAKQYKIGTLVWKSKSSLANPEVRRDFFRQLRECGVVGVKIDFIDSETLDAVNFYTDTLKDAADYKLMIIFHGCDKPTGLERTWPNEMGREGIPGLEKRPPWAGQNCILPFTRLLAGHADFTPMSFKRQKIGETSYAHQIATALSYTTSMQNVGAHPYEILTNAAVDFIKKIPVCWDETVVLPASKIGELLAFARRKGDTWFVCVLNGHETNATTVQLALPFLGKGTYDAAIVKDNPDDPYTVALDSARVSATNSVTVQMRAGGGWAARFSISNAITPAVDTTNRTATVDSGNEDPESSTRWNRSPQWVNETNGGYRSIGLKSFEGAEEPIMKYVAPERKAQHDGFLNIADSGNGAVRMFLRYRGDWWDGDQGTTRRDRQRAEIKGLGPHQKDGETFEYGTTFRTDPDFTGSGRFCHIFQLKATDGDKGAPLVVLSIMSGTNNGALRYYSGNDGFAVARPFTWNPGEWETVRIRVKTSVTNAGELMLSVNGDEFQGVKDLPMFRPDSTDYRPKWGLYRGTVPGMHDDWIEHKDAIARKLTPPDASVVPSRPMDKGE